MTGTSILLESRFKKGYTLQGLSDISGVPRGSITRILHYNSCKTSNLFKLCKALDISIVIDGILIEDYNEYTLKYKYKTTKILSKFHDVVLKEKS
jgi:DNA-binding Xre family transcriptional regulator